MVWIYPMLVCSQRSTIPHTAHTDTGPWIDFVVDCGFSVTTLMCAYPKSRFISITGWIYLICGFRLNI